MYFCQDTDLLPWEPTLFLDPAFTHQALFQQATGTLTATALVMDSPVLAHVLPGMVARVETADDALTQLLEVVAIADTTHATLSALRGRASEDPIPPLTGGSVKVTVISFRPQIAAVGDHLLALLGIASDRLADPAPAPANLVGFRTATIFATLAALFRTLAESQNAANLTLSKMSFYDNLARSARRTIAATIDTDNDDIPDTNTHAATPTLERN